MTLDELGLKHGTDKNSLYHGYCAIYERYFAPMKDKPIVLLEIGVQFGLSMKMWLEYFTKGLIYGIDVANAFDMVDPGLRLWQGSQTDPAFVSRVTDGGETHFDIVIDDGCHIADAQITSFELLWPCMKPGGIYVIEDCFTWSDPHPMFQSPADGYRWLAERTADLFQHGKQYHGKPKPLPKVELNDYEKTLDYIHLYKGLVIIGHK